MRRRLFWAMFGVAIGAVVVGGAVAAVVGVRAVEAQASDELARQAEAIGLQMERLLATPAAEREGSVRQFLALVQNLGGHDYVEVLQLQAGGGLRSLSDASALAGPLGLAEIDYVPGTAVERRGEVGGDRVVGVAIAVPLRQGALVVALARKTALFTGADLVRALLLAAAAAVGVAALLATRLSRPVADRVARLSAAVGRVARGDLAVEVDGEGDDELAELGRGFNEMAGTLASARRRERDFLLNVGHELRTPLTTLAGYAEAMEEGALDGEDLVRVAGVMQTQTQRLRRLVEDLMLLSRLEAREFTLRPEPVDLAAHIGEVVEAFRPRAEQVGVRLMAELDEVGTVAVDPDRVGQVVANLAENALRYTPEGRAVTVRLRVAPASVVIEVDDTGPGIDPDDLPRLFERLYVAQRYRPVRPEGSGLGLSIVKELVDAMAGTVDVTSTPGEGTTVAVCLPVSP